jgi:uncharacterized membrane protein YesL
MAEGREKDATTISRMTLSIMSLFVTPRDTVLSCWVTFFIVMLSVVIPTVVIMSVAEPKKCN